MNFEQMSPAAKLAHIETLARALMVSHQLYYWRFKWNNAKHFAGMCKYRSEIIVLSKPLALLRSFENTRDTILHEIAHALVGGKQGHNEVWKSKALEIGCNGERCYDDAHLEPRFVGTCPNGHTIKRHRRNRISCSRCSSKFNPELLFKWSISTEV